MTTPTTDNIVVPTDDDTNTTGDDHNHKVTEEHHGFTEMVTPLPAGASVATFLGAFVLYIVASIAIAALGFIVFTPDADQQVALSLASSVLAFAVTIAFTVCARPHIRKQCAQWMGLTNVSWARVGYGALCGAGIYAGLTIVSVTLTLSGITSQDSDTSAFVSSTDGVWRAVVLGLMVPVVAPVMEELFFRGLLNNLLMGAVRTTEHKTLVVSLLTSTLFALLHFQGFNDATDVVVLATTFTVGMVSSSLFFSSRSIYPCMALHITYNGISSLMLALSS